MKRSAQVRVAMRLTGNAPAKTRGGNVGVGIKFDTLARMGRMAEDDQAPVLERRIRLASSQHSGLRPAPADRGSLDRWIRATTAPAFPANSLSRPSGCTRVSWARYCVRCQKRERSGIGTKHSPGRRLPRGNRAELAKPARADRASSALRTFRWLPRVAPPRCHP